jgi:prolyl oligopeptidase
MIIPEGDDSIVTDFWSEPTVLVTNDGLYVTYQLGGPSEIRVFDHRGKRLPGPQQAPVSAVGGMARLADDAILFRTVSFVQPATYFRYVTETGKTEKTAFAATSPVRFDDAEVVREFALSKDGTKVPVSIIMPKGTRRDAANPCLVTGYGGYGVNIEPRYRASIRLLLDQGFVYAVANLRGGGEYGETWHLQGNLTNKQNVFDDFAAVLRHLSDRKYTSPERLAIQGGSNGGLLMGAALTQFPSLFRCVISYVGIYDMLRVELAPNGAFNIPEFGTVKNPEQFRALYAYSPYHNVTDGTAYPATLFLTGANDPRVDPMHSRKMTARLQAATNGMAPILLRTSADSGHGGDTSLRERIDQSVDAFAFLFNRLGLRYNDTTK